MFCSNAVKSGSEGCTAMVLCNVGGGFRSFHCHQAEHNEETHVLLWNCSFANWTVSHHEIAISPEF